VAKFDYSRDFKNINFRQHPELYQIGVGEQGVLLVEPYKGEILPHWRFRTPEIARESSQKIYELFLQYREQGDFVGMDMARKFLQMGITRARRYANHQGGRKYADREARARGEALPITIIDEVKAESARIFREKYLLVKEDPEYLRLMDQHRRLYDPSYKPRK
jgi:hypothetical protein